MNAFADTNWLEALYICAEPANSEAAQRAEIVERRTRKEQSLIISHIVLLEARNIFSRVTGEANPAAWQKLIGDFNGKIYVDPMNWDLLRQETARVFERFSNKAVIGTFDAAIIASALLAGAREFLSFDEELKGLATALGLKVYPPLNDSGRACLLKLRAK